MRGSVTGGWVVEEVIRKYIERQGQEDPEQAKRGF